MIYFQLIIPTAEKSSLSIRILYLPKVGAVVSEIKQIIQTLLHTVKNYYIYELSIV